MKTLNYPHCVVCDDVVFLSESKLSCRPAFETYMENVTVSIDDNGVAVDISGDEVLFDYAFEKTRISDLTEMPEEKYIKHCKGLKIFGFYLIKPYDYVKGLYRLKERKPKRIIINKYKLDFVN